MLGRADRGTWQRALVADGRSLMVGESEAGAADSVDANGGAQLVELAAQALDEGLNVTRAPGFHRVPHPRMQVSERPGPQRVAVQAGQQGEFEPCQSDLA